MLQKFILILSCFFSFLCYSQVGEYIDNFSGSSEHTTHQTGSHFNYYTYISIRPNKTFELIKTEYSSKNTNNCTEIEGIWTSKNGILYLNDEDNNQLLTFIIRENSLLDIAYDKYNYLVDDDKLLLEINTDNQLIEFENELIFSFYLKKIKDQSELNNFRQFKELLCN